MRAGNCSPVSLLNDCTAYLQCKLTLLRQCLRKKRQFAWTSKREVQEQEQWERQIAQNGWWEEALTQRPEERARTGEQEERGGDPPKGQKFDACPTPTLQN